MKKTIVSLCFVLFSLQAIMAQQAPLPATEFEKKMQAGKPQVLDVRTAGEYQQSHIADALQADWTNPQQFADRVQYLDKTKPVYVYCAGGVRSALAVKWLREKGFTTVEDLKGGLNAWKMEGKPVVAVENKPQLTIDTYNKSITGSIVLADFGADWCPPCKSMLPVLDNLSKDPSLKFKLVKVDGGNDIEVMKAMKVESIPTFIIYKDGKEVWRKQGVVSEEELKSKL